MPFDPITAALDFGKILLERLIPDKTAAATAKNALEQMRASGELAQIAGQLSINQAEAANPNWFVAGWRPFVGWICGAALGCNMILRPLLAWSSALVGHAVDLPSLDMTTLSTLLMAMLGLGVLRTVEKVQGAEDKR